MAVKGVQRYLRDELVGVDADLKILDTVGRSVLGDLHHHLR